MNTHGEVQEDCETHLNMWTVDDDGCRACKVREQLIHDREWVVLTRYEQATASVSKFVVIVANSLPVKLASEELVSGLHEYIRGDLALVEPCALSIRLELAGWWLRRCNDWTT